MMKQDVYVLLFTFFLGPRKLFGISIVAWAALCGDILLRNKPVFPEVPVKSSSDNSVFSVYTINVSGNMTAKENEHHENISDYFMS